MTRTNTLSQCRVRHYHECGQTRENVTCEGALFTVLVETSVLHQRSSEVLFSVFHGCHVPALAAPCSSQSFVSTTFSKHVSWFLFLCSSLPLPATSHLLIFPLHHFAKQPVQPAIFSNISSQLVVLCVVPSISSSFFSIWLTVCPSVYKRGPGRLRLGLLIFVLDLDLHFPLPAPLSDQLLEVHAAFLHRYPSPDQQSILVLLLFSLWLVQVSRRSPELQQPSSSLFLCTCFPFKDDDAESI